MEAIEFVKSDKVRLISGSPIMVVVEFEGQDKLICRWNVNGVLHEGTFEKSAVVHATKIVREWKVF